MRPKTSLRIAIDIRRYGFKARDVRACTIDDPKRPIMRIYIDLGMHWRKAQRWNRSITWMIYDIIDSHVHEYAHAFIPPGVEDKVEERWALKFERAGRWTRTGRWTRRARSGRRRQ